MTKLLPLLFFGLVLTSCDETKPKDVPIIDESQIEERPQDLETYAKRHVTSYLRIPANEKFTMSIHRANLDGDEKEDAIILVNRQQFAMDEAASSPNPAKRAEMGFMGNYNHFFYYDGGMHLISPAFTIPSSPLLPLTVEFKSISSPNHDDVVLVYRIRNAAYYDLYTIREHTPRRIFQWKQFDGLGTANPEAYSLEIRNNEKSPYKDILVMETTAPSLPKDSNSFTYVPRIEPGKKELYRFFYLKKEQKYVTERN